MRVAIVLNTSWNIYNFRYNLVIRLLSRGYEVYAIAPHDSYSEKLEKMGCKYIPLSMDSRGVNPMKDFALLIELFKIYRKILPDVVLHYTIKPNVYGTLAASLLKIPVVNNVCGLGTAFLQNNLLSVIAKMMYRISFWYPKKIFFQNDDDLELFVDNNIVSKNSADILPGSGIDLTKFKPSFLKSREKLTFLLISRLISDKGVYEYVEAVKLLKKEGVEANFQILGSKDPEHRRGIPIHEIDQWINDGVIEYLGTTEDVRPFINESDCVILPSYREGTPRTLLEAASSTRPIIATDVPGCNNVVVDGYNGFLCKEKDANDLAEKIKLFIKLPHDKRIEMGEMGRKRVEENFDENFVIDKYLNAISDISKKIA
ncbi:MAG: glycosyltransferase family 4 protein [Cyclobacteriaceae bacterium]|nr:glycosyltransferase family 4 protein [Cyclobacteriaceae bacterium]